MDEKIIKKAIEIMSPEDWYLFRRENGGIIYHVCGPDVLADGSGFKALHTDLIRRAADMLSKKEEGKP